MTVLSRLGGLPRRLNPALIPIARRLPPLAVVRHQGRRSGRTYQTPVQAFATETGFIVAMLFNSNANWALNILGANGGEITKRGHRYAISKPRLRGAEARAGLPAPFRALMRSLGIEAFLQFDAARLE